eukprot:GFKZ01015923.1.p1 GENE.GFKZ01015923.1~~GFKZ01015923.1.p1  ORF type:complete len:766 (-),score=122.52 GFKZ01015923.1:784-3081(-)
MQAALPSTAHSSTKSLCFPPSALLHPSFTPQSFISHHRSQTPLRVLRDDLRTHLSSLQSQLVQTVQTNFSTFTSFASSIRDADSLADITSKPLQDLRAHLNSLLNAIDAQIEELDSTLKKRREVKDRITALRTLLQANDLLLKCERLLREYGGMKSAMTDEGLRLVERIAGEAAQLAFVLSRAVDGEFVKGISLRISYVKRGVRTCVDSWLRRALFPKEVKDADVYDMDILARVLGMYVVSGLGREAEEFFRREVVAPFTTSRLKMTPMLAAAERRVGEGVTAADALEEAEGEVMAFLGEKVMPLVSLVEVEERLRGRLDFVGRAVWPQIESAISHSMTAAFSPGIPDVFHKSVLAGGRLYRAVEAAVGEGERNEFRCSKATTDFWRHWNLPVYFQLRFQEVTSKFDEVLEHGPAAVDRGEGVRETVGLLRTDMYLAESSVSLVKSLKRCWAEDVFLLSLTHRFLRLSLQLLARYATWVRTGLAGEWRNEDAVPKGAARVFYDITVLQKRVPAELSSVLRLRAAEFNEDTLDSLDSAFVEATDKFSDLLPELSRSISDSLARSCVENLHPLRGILATYRMSSKQAPTTNSTFVPKILRPLKMFLKEHEGRIGREECLVISTTVAEQTSGEYFNMATDLLQRNKSSEATLRRLNIGRSGALAGSGGGAMSVIDKISMQLYLDVAKFMDDVKGLGVAVTDVPSLGQLWDSVKREDTSETGEQPSAEEARSVIGEFQSTNSAVSNPETETNDSGLETKLVMKTADHVS